MSTRSSLRELLGWRPRKPTPPTASPQVIQVIVPQMELGPMNELFVATVHQDGNETILLWTLNQMGSDGNYYPALTPVMGKTEQNVRDILAAISEYCDIYDMPGANEDISIRRYGPWDHVGWFRRGADPRRSHG